MAKIFELFNKIDREFMKDELKKLKINQKDYDLVSLMTSKLKYLSELLSIYNKENGCSDKIVVFGNKDKFEERKTKPSALKESEVYDASKKIELLKKEGYEIAGGLGGFSFFNGEGAGELIMLPGGETVRAEIRGKIYFAQNVPPLNIYPMLFLTARKQVKTQKDNIYVVIFEDGEDIHNAIKEIKQKSKTKKTVTGALMGNFVSIEGYIFNSAAPKTVLKEIKDAQKRAMFIYQVLCGTDLEKDFGSEIHMHGFEAAKLMDRTGFGSHIYKAKVSGCALGVFGIADEVEEIKQ